MGGGGLGMTTTLLCDCSFYTSLLIKGGGGRGNRAHEKVGGGGGLGMTTTLLCDCSFYLTIRIFTGRIIHSQLSIEPHPP